MFGRKVKHDEIDATLSSSLPLCLPHTRTTHKRTHTKRHDTHAHDTHDEHDKHDKHDNMTKVASNKRLRPWRVLPPQAGFINEFRMFFLCKLYALVPTKKVLGWIPLPRTIHSYNNVVASNATGRKYQHVKYSVVKLILEKQCESSHYRNSRILVN